MNIKKELGEKIKRVRKSRGITQEQLAEMIDISPRSLSNIEVGGCFVKSETLEKILEAKEATSLVESLDYKEEDEFSLYENINTSYNEKMISPEILDLKKGIESLDEFSKELINNRYNLDKTQSETAKSMNVTQVMVSRKEKEILKRLRTRLS